MNKLVHLKMTKQFLLKVVRQRKYIEKNVKNKKPLTESMEASMKSIPYWVSNIDSFDRMMAYISRKEIQAQVIELIPPGNRATMVTELEHLVIEGKILTGELTKQYEISF